MTDAKPSDNHDDPALRATVDVALADTVAPQPLITRTQPAATGAVGARVGGQGAAAIGRFLLLRKLGEGGMGEVYSAFDEQLDRRVAIKVLHAALAPEETQKRTLREAQALARLAHPNVVAVHEVGQVDGDVFVVMEHIDGTTLLDWQNEESRTTRERLEAYCMAGRGLAAVHAAGLVHRDFKPHNAMIDKEGRVRILDFGLAHARGALATAAENTNGYASQGTLGLELTAEGAIVGTPAYMSPEQFLGEPLDARTDQFSFCVALYEALYGKNPFASETPNKAIIPALAGEAKHPPASEDIPFRVTEALMRGLSRDREARFPTMDELLAVLENIPHVDPSGQMRQRVVFSMAIAAAIGVFQLLFHLGKEYVSALVEAVLPAITLVVVMGAVTYHYRHTLFRNPFHRARVLWLLVGGLMLVGSRAMGIKNHETVEVIATRDTFISATAITIGLIFWVPRVAATWVMSAVSILGLVALILWPQYLGIIAAVVMNATAVAFFVAWHQSAKIAPVAESTTTTAMATTKRTRKQK